MDTRTLMECDNVNGVKLSLKMETGFFSNISTCSPKSRKFTITYKSERNRSSWARTSLFIAVLFNIVVFSYIRISFTAFAYITLIFSFLAFFWVTHSVQSGKKSQYKPCSSYLYSWIHFLAFILIFHVSRDTSSHPNLGITKLCEICLGQGKHIHIMDQYWRCYH